ncbi:MAG: ATP-binding cassette domain-containing protein [Thiobacillus sp.]|nr:ATP-binding cassette domain-containing protein [Thiobacillus sp.]
MISFNQVTKRYPGGHEALSSVSLTIEQGELLFLSGHSGAGKSTLLKLIAAIERPTSGVVSVSGQNISRLPRRAVPYLRRNIGLVFQDHKLLFDRSVIDNVVLPLDIAGLDRRESLKRARAVIDKVGLLALLLADEPTGNLDAGYAADIMAMFRDFHQVGTTLVIATHDERAITALGGRTLHLDHGKIEEISA